LAACIAAESDAPLCLFLEGDLGAGKTTFARGFMGGLGHDGRVPSPTYTLVEPYLLSGRSIWHLDLYRLGDGAELEYLGITEMTEPGAVMLIEWPDRGKGYLPDNDLLIRLKVISDGRMLSIEGFGERGLRLSSAFHSAR